LLCRVEASVASRNRTFVRAFASCAQRQDVDGCHEVDRDQGS
jgi:hypothetical protein